MKTSDHAFAALGGLKLSSFAPTDRSIHRLSPDTADRMIAFDYSGLLVGGNYGEFAVMTPDASFLAFRSADAQRGSALHRAWYGYREFARSAGQPQTVKAAMALRGKAAAFAGRFSISTRRNGPRSRGSVGRCSRRHGTCKIPGRRAARRRSAVKLAQTA